MVIFPSKAAMVVPPSRVRGRRSTLRGSPGDWTSRLATNADQHGSTSNTGEIWRFFSDLYIPNFNRIDMVIHIEIIFDFIADMSSKSPPKWHSWEVLDPFVTWGPYRGHWILGGWDLLSSHWHHLQTCSTMGKSKSMPVFTRVLWTCSRKTSQTDFSM